MKEKKREGIKRASICIWRKKRGKNKKYKAAIKKKEEEERLGYKAII